MDTFNLSRSAFLNCWIATIIVCFIGQFKPLAQSHDDLVAMGKVPAKRARSNRVADQLKAAACAPSTDQNL